MKLLRSWIFGYSGLSRNANRRPEIDGLRGVAVISVFAYHLDLQFARGGFVGVDIFFVLSGFVITRMIVDQVSNGDFKYFSFLIARAKRLAPNLFAMLIATSLVGFFVFDTGQLAKLGQDALAAGLYISNIVFMFETPYFFVDGASNPLLHTWSLGVEEQFYLLYPILIALLVKRSIGLVFVGSVITVASFLLWLTLFGIEGQIYENIQFFSLPARAWQLGLGAMVFFLSADKYILKTKVTSSIASITLSFGLIFSITHPELTQSIRTLVAVFSVALLLLATKGKEDSPVVRSLSSSFLVGAGLLSYSLYLWHFPVISLVKNVSGSASLDTAQLWISVLLTLVFSILALKFVENPIRNAPLKPRKFLTSIGGGILSLVLLSVAFQQPANAFPPEYQAAIALETNEFIFSQALDERLFQRARLEHGGGVRDYSVLVIGNSRAMQLNSENGESLNLSVSSASIEDLYTLSILGATKTKAAEVLLVIDAVHVLSVDQNDRWRVYEEDYEIAKSAVDQNTPLELVDFPKSGKLSDVNLISGMYAEMNLFSEIVKPDGSEPELRDKKRKNGTHIYNERRVANPKNKPVEARAAFERGGIGESTISSSKLLEIESLIRFLQGQGIGVKLLLVPYHPEYYQQAIRRDERPIVTAEGYLKERAKLLGVTISGGYDPDLMGCSEKDFIDALHPFDSCLTRLDTEFDKIMK